MAIEWDGPRRQKGVEFNEQEEKGEERQSRILCDQASIHLRGGFLPHRGGGSVPSLPHPHPDDSSRCRLLISLYFHPLFCYLNQACQPQERMFNSVPNSIGSAAVHSINCFIAIFTARAASSQRKRKGRELEWERYIYIYIYIECNSASFQQCRLETLSGGEAHNRATNKNDHILYTLLPLRRLPFTLES